MQRLHFAAIHAPPWRKPRDGAAPGRRAEGARGSSRLKAQPLARQVPHRPVSPSGHEAGDDDGQAELPAEPSDCEAEGDAEAYLTSHRVGPPSSARHPTLPARTLAALGIVFGDIGTSPLYALRACFDPQHGVEASAENVLGVLSLIFWSLTLVVTVKYLLFVMRASNGGEGGILALLALVPERLRFGPTGKVRFVALLLVAGAALLYGDGMITPAISVLSALEGVEVIAPRFSPLIVPGTIGILLALFALQSRGTSGVGKLFGPVMAVWFVTIGLLGAYHAALHPGVLRALSPHHAVLYFARHGWGGVFILGSVVLAVTGGEALYADMGHFGAAPIRLAWFLLAMPALVLNYFGQGALVLARPSLADRSFFAMVPPGTLTCALVVLATLATIIASQALISGAFSLTHQAVQLGFFPFVEVRHTSREAAGQIYVPVMNWLLAAGAIALVLAFRESSRLAAAYGIAVTGTMVITSWGYFVVARSTWGWRLSRALPLLALFLAFDIPFLVANLAKFVDGGFVPVLFALVVFTVMVVWNDGRRRLRDAIQASAPEPDLFFRTLPDGGGSCSPGTGVFLSSVEEAVPPVLTRQLARVHALPVQIVILTVRTTDAPAVLEADRVSARRLSARASRVVVQYGFIETPDIPRALAAALSRLEITTPVEQLTYYVGRDTFLAGRGGRMNLVAKTLFAFLARNASSTPARLELPPEQVVELGSQRDL